MSEMITTTHNNRRYKKKNFVNLLKATCCSDSFIQYAYIIRASLEDFEFD